MTWGRWAAGAFGGVVLIVYSLVRFPSQWLFWLPIGMVMLFVSGYELRDQTSPGVHAALSPRLQRNLRLGLVVSLVAVGVVAAWWGMTLDYEQCRVEADKSWRCDHHRADLSDLVFSGFMSGFLGSSITKRLFPDAEEWMARENAKPGPFGVR